jgi:SAM-dependent methyltransferase
VSGFPETADVETSSDDYARRFAGPVGDWFLERQAATTRELLGDLPASATVLDVGGGHGQLTPMLVAAGYDVLVTGSDASCASRLAPWLRAGRCRFEVGNVIALAHADRSFDAVLAFRLLPHVARWRELVTELCRVSRRIVIVDYPSSRSLNLFAERGFTAKKRFEGNTRPFTLFSPAEIRAALAAIGFAVTDSRPQFFWPMVLHRMLGSRGAARALEAPAGWLGLTRLAGSPVIIRAERSN